MLSQKEMRELKEKKARDAQGLFLVEGQKMVLETPKECLVQIVLSADYANSKEGLRAIEYAQALSLPIQTDISEQHFRQLADTQTPQGILAVARMPRFSLEEVLGAGSGPVLVLDGLQDPGNLGTIIRTAEAFGGAGVLLCGGGADIYQPKVVRSTMGSLFRVPHFVIEDTAEALRLLRAAEFVTYASYLHEAAGDHTAADLSGRCAIFIGNESRGLPAETAALCDRTIRIPMEGEIESLNAAIAAGILLYEAWRQRRQA